MTSVCLHGFPLASKSCPYCADDGAERLADKLAGKPSGGSHPCRQGRGPAAPLADRQGSRARPLPSTSTALLATELLAGATQLRRLLDDGQTLDDESCSDLKKAKASISSALVRSLAS